MNALKTHSTHSLSDFPRRISGIICGYKNDGEDLPSKIMEMGLLPETPFVILYQAPLSGPLYIEFGQEKSRIALRPEEAEYILVERQEAK